MKKFKAIRIDETMILELRWHQIEQKYDSRRGWTRSLVWREWSWEREELRFLLTAFVML
jgi:hypothetical protein